MTDPFFEFVTLVVNGSIEEVVGRLDRTPGFATAAANNGATRENAQEFFLVPIRHYLYAGDTALHMAAAAFRRPMAELLIGHGADPQTRNRRGAQPLHYAADTNRWDPAAQAETIEYLISIGADPNARDNDGVTPLHRAVRTRSSPAVAALIDHAADLTLRKKAGSTPLHLAVQTTGRSDSGSEHALDQQRRIIGVLVDRGADLFARDGKGRNVIEAASSKQIKDLLTEL